MNAAGQSAGRERGAGTVLAAAVCALGVAVAGVLASLGSALVAGRRADGAADLAALAAAATDPPDCGRAARVAAADGATLRSCAALPDGSVSVAVTVEAGAAWLPLPRSEGRARAGRGTPVAP